MAKLTADFLLERLVENGVRRIYGYPGDGINAIVGALDRHREELEFVQVRHLVDRAHRIALARRAPTCVIVPNDVAEEPAEEQEPREHGSVHSAPGYVPPRVVPPREQLERAAEILNAGEKVAMLVGAGALHATDEVVEVAEALGAGVAKALLGRTAVPDDLPFVTGSI